MLDQRLRVALATREFPPHVYGGAGVHVDFLSRELRHIVDLQVLCAGDERPHATGFPEKDPRFPDANAALHVLSMDLAMTAAAADADVVHTSTWYANMAGHLAKLLYGCKHVVTSHSLEPGRPWKEEQLGGGYRLSSWAEKTAYEGADAVITVSNAMAADIRAAYPAIPQDKIHVIYNGIDSNLYRPVPEAGVVSGLGIDPGRPYVTFVGRITRQKGVPHLLRAAQKFDPSIQLLLLAGAPDTPELKAETDEPIGRLKATRSGVVVVGEMLPAQTVREILSHALAFICPSIYEPLGIVNLEAMACECPVVASAVGGIPEVVDDGTTGILVPYTPSHPEAFEQGLADAVNALAADPATALRFGRAGRQRVLDEFRWPDVARRTVDLYMSLQRS